MRPERGPDRAKDIDDLVKLAPGGEELEGRALGQDEAADRA